MKILLETIKHSEQRYKTVGDWFQREDGTVVIRSSKLSDPRLEFLILIHELVEWFLCLDAGISQQVVDEFDKEHEDEQDEVELGDLSDAPYRTQHCFATGIERLLAAELDVDWDSYEEELIGLS